MEIGCLGAFGSVANISRLGSARLGATISVGFAMDKLSMGDPYNWAIGCDCEFGQRQAAIYNRVCLYLVAAFLVALLDVDADSCGRDTRL